VETIQGPRASRLPWLPSSAAPRLACRSAATNPYPEPVRGGGDGLLLRAFDRGRSAPNTMRATFDAGARVRASFDAVRLRNSQPSLATNAASGEPRVTPTFVNPEAVSKMCDTLLGR